MSDNTREWVDSVMLQIEARYETKGKSMSDNLATRFTACLCNMEQQRCEQAVKTVLDETPYLPCAEEIEVEYARLLSPYPTADEAWLEVQDWVEGPGIYSKLNPDYPAKSRMYCLEGDPGQWTHPLIGRIVDKIGWRWLVKEPLSSQEGYFMFKRLYEAAAREWQLSVIRAVAGRCGVPDGLLPGYTPYVKGNARYLTTPPAVWRRLMEPKKPEPLPEECTRDIRGLIKQIDSSFRMPDGDDKNG